MRYLLAWFPLSDASRRYIRRTTTGCRAYRSSLSGCRFGCSGSSGFVGSFLRLRLSNCVPAPRCRSCRDRCRYRYICCPGGLPSRGGCRPKQSGFALRDEGCMKNVFSDNLTEFCWNSIQSIIS